jgi:hypothetical protein
MPSLNTLPLVGYNFQASPDLKGVGFIRKKHFYARLNGSSLDFMVLAFHFPLHAEVSQIVSVLSGLKVYF